MLDWKTLILITVIILLSSCSAPQKSINASYDNSDIHEGQKNPYIHIIINDKEVKDQEYGPEFISKLKDVFSKSFNNVSVLTGYESRNIGKVVVTPQEITSTLSNDTNPTVATAKSRIEVSFNDIKNSITIDGRGIYEPSEGERWGGLALAAVTLSASAHVQIASWKSIAHNRALESIAADLHSKIVSSSEFSSYAESSKMLKTYPANLYIKIQYSDNKSIIANNSIDAGEISFISANITNSGKGTAFDVQLKTETDNKYIEFPNIVLIGDIPPGETRETKVKVKAALDIADGNVPFNITCSEKRGYDCKAYKLNVRSAHYEKPEIVINGYRLNDSNSGLANGNGNGIPENGETIEIIPFVKNDGVGNAINVDLSIKSINSGLDVKNWSVTIPKIFPGQTVTGNLAFSIPSTFADNTINLRLEARDIRGEAEVNRQFALNTEINRPVLAYTYRILDGKGNTRSSIQNGEDAWIELIPSNKGKLESRDISINLDSDSISFSKTRDTITRIGAESRYSPVRFPFQIPRTIERNSVDVRVKLSQKDFPGINDTINIPLSLVRPDFSITYQLLDRNNNGVLEQGESADILVNVKNTGRLAADDVRLDMDINKKGVLITGGKEANLGRIESGRSTQKKFSINVQRAADAGELPVNFTVTEKEFGNKEIVMTMNIAEEQEEVIIVKGAERPQQDLRPSSSYYNFPPTLAIASPRPGQRVASDNIMLSGVATDDKGVSSIEIMVNGKRIDIDTRALKMKAGNNNNSKEQSFYNDIMLQTGKNIITITAYDTDNLTNSREVTVYRESNRGEMWAAVIGINQYKNSELTLKYARNDAESFADYMKNNMGLGSDHIFELYDIHATLRNMRKLLGTELRRKVKKEDTLFIYFAGHGAPEDDLSSPDPDKIRKYILPYDVEIEDLYTSAVAMDEIADIFSRIQAERIIFVVDSCYSGAGGGRTILARNRRAVLSDEFLNRIADGKGRIILTSSSQNETSKESDRLKHGYFTYYLLEGLRGGADLNRDNLVDIDEISFYLNKHVPEATDNAQHPVKKGQAEGQLIMGRVR